MSLLLGGERCPGNSNSTTHTAIGINALQQTQFSLIIRQLGIWLCRTIRGSIIGVWSMPCNPTHRNDNSAFGYQALSPIRSRHAFSFGYQPWMSNTTGSDNSRSGPRRCIQHNGVPKYCLLDTITAVKHDRRPNSAFGYQALQSNTASDNTAMGFQALQANTTVTKIGLRLSVHACHITGSENAVFGTRPCCPIR